MLQIVTPARILTGIGPDGKEQRVVIAADGTMQMIYSDALATLGAGSARVERASHVEPAPGGGWLADMAPAGGPVLTGFALHSDAIAAELAWLRAHRGL